LTVDHELQVDVVVTQLRQIDLIEPLLGFLIGYGASSAPTRNEKIVPAPQFTIERDGDLLPRSFVNLHGFTLAIIVRRGVAWTGARPQSTGK
jgi:hypothetical protein